MKKLTLFNLILKIQLIVSIGFLLCLIKLHVTVLNTEQVIIKEQGRSTTLNKLLDSIVKKSVISNNKSEKNDIAAKDTSKQTSLMIKNPQSIYKAKSRKILDTTQKIITIIAVEPVIKSQKNYYYKFTHDVILNNYQTLKLISAQLTLKNSQSGNGKQTLSVNPILSMIQVDEDNPKGKLLSFKCLKNEIMEDSFINLTIIDITQPKTSNELDPLNYNKNLQAIISGKISGKYLSTLLLWNDIGGRPLSAKVLLSLDNEH